MATDYIGGGPGSTAGAGMAPPAPAWLVDALAAAGGWLPFDDFMNRALHAPGSGYYAAGGAVLGRIPADGSDFATAPELTPLFGQTLAVQVGEALAATQTREVWEFGAGSGALAQALLAGLDALGAAPARYVIVELSAALRARQRERLAAFGSRVVWADALPDRIAGVVVGNEVLDAMPVKLLARRGGVWHERGVALADGAPVWTERPTGLRPPLEPAGPHDYRTEIHPQAEAFVRTLGERLARGAAFFIDYGFPEAEYYHPQRHMGTLVGHRQHRVVSDDAALLHLAGHVDLTAHVNFTGIALAAQQTGLSLLGYTTQARFLMNCGLLQRLAQAGAADRAAAQKLLTEHEMGELFKVIGLAAGEGFAALGFATGDRSHRL